MKMESPGGQRYRLFVDMAEQQHLLVAGAAGSGKSVVINGIVSTLLYRFPSAGAGGVGFILIDPKRVELATYRNLPHTIRYASEPADILSALSLAVKITDGRYIEMQKRGVKKYSGADIYVIIDEFADLMTTQRRAVQPLVQRLAQIGRAARVHIILATQTPIAKVLPTEIKCNFDARVGLRTRSAQDSRNIIGLSGLEKLPRYGRGYYMTPEGEAVYDIPYVDDEELKRLVDHWEQQERQQKKGVLNIFGRGR